MTSSNPAKTTSNAGRMQDGLFGRFWRAPYLLLVLAVLFWSGNFIVGRVTMDRLSPVTFAFWRWVLALLVLVPVALPHLWRDWRGLARQWPMVFVLGALGIGAFNTLVYAGLQQTTAINGLLLQSTMPVIILGATFLLYGQKSSARQILGVLVSLAGVAVIALRGDWSGLAALDVNRGDLWVLVAVLAYALYSALLRKKPQVHPLSFLAASFAVGVLCLLPLYLAELLGGGAGHWRAGWSAPSFLALAYVALLPGVLSYLFFNRGVELIGANTAGHFIHLMPIFGSLMAVFLLGERFQSFHAIGAALIAAGLALAMVRQRG